MASLSQEVKATERIAVPQSAEALVLIVEDEALIAMAIADALEDAGFVTRTAASLAEAREFPPDQLTAAIVDLRLSDMMPGQEVVRWLRDIQPCLPIIVVTGFSQMAPEANLRGLGGPTRRLHKPDHLPDLVPTLRELLTECGAGEAPPRRRRGEAA